MVSTSSMRGFVYSGCSHNRKMENIRSWRANADQLSLLQIVCVEKCLTTGS